MTSHETSDTAAGVWLGFTPRDAVHVRDGRPFDAGGTARTLRPWPSTVAGASGAAFGREVDAVRGPLPAMRDTVTRRWKLRFPVPADVVPLEGRSTWTRLRPQRAGAVTDLDQDGVHGLAADRAGPSSEDMWWDAAQLSRYLDDPENVPEGEAALSPFTLERRTGVAREGRVVRDSHLYSSAFLRLPERPKTEWTLAAFCDLPADWPGSPDNSPVPLGGGGRLADVATLTPQPEWPSHPAAFPEGKVLLYLAKPGIWRYHTPEGEWRTGWRPPLPAGAILRAAAVPRPEAVASASPRPDGTVRDGWLRWAVPAGTVYLIQFTGDDPAAAALAWAERTHCRALGAERNNPDPTARRLATAGFGLTLTGRWQ